MNSYVVILKLGYQESTYVNLMNYLKSGAGWARPRSNTWIIRTPLNAVQLRNGIRLYINLSDVVYVFSFNELEWAASNGDKAIIEWLHSKPL